MKIIGIHGQSRCGKDTVCQILTESYPNIKFEKQGFADALKVSAARAIGLEGSWSELITKMDDLKSEGQINTPWGKISGRQLLQYYGTEAHRDMFGKDFWLDQVIPDPFDPARRANGEYRKCDVLLIPDVRYQNEAERIVEAQCRGYLWLVRRDVQGHTTGHVSENNVNIGWDQVIDNNNSIDELTDRVKSIFRPIAEDIANERIERAIHA